MSGEPRKFQEEPLERQARVRPLALDDLVEFVDDPPAQHQPMLVQHESQSSSRRRGGRQECRDEDVRVDEDTTHELRIPHLVDECLDVVAILQARLVSGTCERCLDPCKCGQSSLCEHDLTVRPLNEEHFVASYKVQPAAHLGGAVI